MSSGLRGPCTANNLDSSLSTGGKGGGRGQRRGALAQPPTHCRAGAVHAGAWEPAARRPVHRDGDSWCVPDGPAQRRATWGQRSPPARPPARPLFRE